MVSAVAIAIAGTKISIVADRLADRTGIGEALIGAVLLGASTSLSGSVLSAISAYDGMTDLAISNALGGIAAQTFFLVLADIFYFKANLEHSAASSTNIMLAMLLVVLLCLPVMGLSMPEFTWFSIHPITLILFGVYFFGIQYVSKEKKDPMWKPTKTLETVEDEPNEPIGGKQLKDLILKFVLYSIILVVSGFTIKSSGVALAKNWGINHLVLGALFTAIITSLPELITTFAAIRQGALSLAVGGIVGGNTFDVLFLAFSDVAYRQGSIYHKMSNVHVAYISITITMTAVLAMGLIRREKHGFANIGTESFVIAILYIFSLILLLVQ